MLTFINGCVVSGSSNFFVESIGVYAGLHPNFNVSWSAQNIVP